MSERAARSRRLGNGPKLRTPARRMLAREEQRDVTSLARKVLTEFVENARKQPGGNA